MNFEGALSHLKGVANGQISRSGWNGKGMFVKLQRPDNYSKMTHPYLYMSTPAGGLVPWMPSQTDIMGEDWEIV